MIAFCVFLGVEFGVFLLFLRKNAKCKIISCGVDFAGDQWSPLQCCRIIVVNIEHGTTDLQEIFSYWVGNVCIVLKKGTQTISEGNTIKKFHTPMPTGVGVREVFAELFN